MLFRSHQVPLGENQNLVADVLHLGEDVGAENHGVPVPELLDQGADFNNLDGVKANRGLIQDNDAGVAQQGLCDADSLLKAFGKGADAPALNALNFGLGYDLPNLPLELFAPQSLCLTDKAQIL